MYASVQKLREVRPKLMDKPTTLRRGTTGYRPWSRGDITGLKERVMKIAFSRSWVVMGALIAGLTGCAGSGEKSGAYVDDSWITTKVKSEMVGDNDVSARNISVNTTNGVVTLTGTAANWQESNRATEIARNVAGVKAVRNEIRIQ
jgi:hyperosmotically inducible periplasmic protein